MKKGKDESSLPSYNPKWDLQKVVAFLASDSLTPEKKKISKTNRKVKHVNKFPTFPETPRKSELKKSLKLFPDLKTLQYHDATHFILQKNRIGNTNPKTTQQLYTKTIEI